MIDAGLAREIDNQPISVGGVLSQLFAAVWRHKATFYVVALAFVPLQCVQFLTRSMPKGPTLTVINGGVLTAQVIGGAIVQAALTFAMAEALRGGPFSLRNGFAAGLSRFFPYIITTVILYAIAGLGSMLLLVPGAIALCVYAMSPVVALVERTGPVAGQSRSRQLTRRNRWRIFAVLLVLYAPLMILFGGIAAYTAVNAVQALAAGRQDVGVVASQLVGVQVASIVVTFVLAPIYFAWPAVLYHHLRRAEGAGGPGNLAEVFA